MTHHGIHVDEQVLGEVQILERVVSLEIQS